MSLSTESFWALLWELALLTLAPCQAVGPELWCHPACSYTAVTTRGLHSYADLKAELERSLLGSPRGKSGLFEAGLGKEMREGVGEIGLVREAIRS